MKTTRWTQAVIAMGMAVLLVGANIAVAKPRDGERGKGRGKHSDSRGKKDDNERGKGKNDDRGTRGPGEEKEKPGKGKPSAEACDAASSVIMAFVDATCPCDGTDDGNGGVVAWKNHGQYVRCVTHAVKDATRAAGVKRRCAKGIVPCAARSTCGKKRGVTCVMTSSPTCMNGGCAGDTTVPCTTDADCVTSTCAITSAERCTELGGTAGTGSCCTATDGSPSGAFLD